MMPESNGQKPTRPLSIVYVLLYFPHLTETFVANEINAIASLGHQVRIISLLSPKKDPVQPLSKSLLKHAMYAPGFLSLKFWKAQFYFLVRSGPLWFQMLGKLLACPSKGILVPTLKRLVVFLRSVAVAYELKDKDVDVLHSHFAWLSGEGAWVCSRLLNRPFTVTIHAFDIFTKTDLLKLVVCKADHVVSISAYNRNYIINQKLCSVNNISVIHCGVDLSEFTCQTGGNRALLPQKQIRIISVGSLTEKKGHTYLIEACRLLGEKGGMDFTCTIIGGGREMTSLQHQVESCGLQKKVILPGSLTSKEIHEAYRKSDIFVLASVVAESGDRDGIPVVIMEAAAVGLPVISTDVSGIPELVRHKETGWLVPPEDPEALAEAIVILATDHDLRKRLIRNARELVASEFNQQVNAHRLIDVFNRVHASSGESRKNA